MAGVLAGVSDSRLTNHGVLQTQRLGQYLTTHRNLSFTRIYASDLQRAFMTAEEIQKNQLAHRNGDHLVPSVVKLDLLREQDFGSLELVRWAGQQTHDVFGRRVPSSDDPAFRPGESTEAMTARAETFLADFILPLFATQDPPPDSASECVAVVSHGLFLSILWQTLLTKLEVDNVSLGPDIESFGYSRPLAYLPSWSNTAFLELTIHRPEASVPTAELARELDTKPMEVPLPLSGHSMTVHAINGKDHLVDLKRARGGLGSSAYDSRQKSLDGFFKRPRGDGSNA